MTRTRTHPETVNHYINANVRYNERIFYIVTNNADVKPLLVRFLYCRRNFDRVYNNAHMMRALHSYIVNIDEISEIQTDGMMAHCIVLISLLLIILAMLLGTITALAVKRQPTFTNVPANH